MDERPNFPCQEACGFVQSIAVNWSRQKNKYKEKKESEKLAENRANA